MLSSTPSTAGLRGWLIHNHKVALLASLLLLLAGILTATSIRTEVFPPFRPGFVTVTVQYDGASVQEVHDSVLLPLESVSSSLRNVRTTRGYARPSVATLQLELEESADPDTIAAELQRLLDALDTLPVTAETPVVEIDRAGDPLMSVIVYGSASPSDLRASAASIRAELLAALPSLRIELQANTIERLIDVPIEALRAHNLTISEIGSALEALQEQSGIGRVEGDGSTHMSEVLGGARAASLQELTELELSLPDGLTARLGSLGTAHERFAGPDEETTLNGYRAVQIDIYNQAGSSPPVLSGSIRETLAGTQLPAGVNARVWADTSGEFSGRLDLVIENGLLGFVLVLFVLGLFVSPRVAVWVAIGLPVVLVGSIAVWGTLGVSLNQMTLFALLLVLGIVVDDSIVVGEAIETAQTDRGDQDQDAATAGARDVWLPVVCAVATNIVAFMPLAFVPGELGVLFAQLALVVLCVLAISLLEAGYLLPAHLSRASIPIPASLYIPSQLTNKALMWIASKLVVPSVQLGIRFPIPVTLCTSALVILGIGPLLNGTIGWRFTPLVESDQVELSYVLPRSTSMNEARGVRYKAEQAAAQAARSLGISSDRIAVLSSIGGSSGEAEEESVNVPGPHRITLSVDLGPARERDHSASEFAAAWQDSAPVINDSIVPQVNAYALGGGADELVFELTHSDETILGEATNVLGRTLSDHSAVLTVDAADSEISSLTVGLHQTATELGIRNRDISQELNSAMYGYTSDRYAYADGEYEVRVRVSPGQLLDPALRDLLPIRTADGSLVPFSLVGELTETPSDTQLVRRDGRPISVVVATINEGNPEAEQLEEELMLKLQESYPGLGAALAGEAEAEGRALMALATNSLLAAIAMFAILVIPLKSFSQPVLLILSLPLGLAGGVLCHVAMGIEFSMVSLLGTVALCGVLINDGLILLYTATHLKNEGMAPREAATRAAQSRFRPIVLTTLTTAAGLAPLIFETDEQSQFLTPMVLTLGGGLLFVSPILLVVMPGLWVRLQYKKFENE